MVMVSDTSAQPSKRRFDVAVSNNHQMPVDEQQHSCEPTCAEDGSSMRPHNSVCNDDASCSNVVTSAPSGSSPLFLLDLNVEILELVLQEADCLTLVNAARTCRLLDTLINRRQTVVRNIVTRMCRPSEPDRWRRLSWLQRLQLEEHHSPFDVKRCQECGFTFHNDAVTGRCTTVRLDGNGPKLLVSEKSTLDVPLLRWRFELRGNNALEVGVVPQLMQAEHKTLHKCLAGPSPEEAMPCGAFSTITVGSKLPIRLPLMRGSMVEMVARRGSLEVLAHNPANGQELQWVNGAMEPKAYRGPARCSLELSFPPDCPMKLAATCWAKCELQLH